MLLNATFNNISVILWLSVSLEEDTGVPEEKHWPATNHWQTLFFYSIFSIARILHNPYVHHHLTKVSGFFSKNIY
jgi:hypothetical protein